MPRAVPHCAVVRGNRRGWAARVHAREGGVLAAFVLIAPLMVAFAYLATTLPRSPAQPARAAAAASSDRDPALAASRPPALSAAPSAVVARPLRPRPPAEAQAVTRIAPTAAPHDARQTVAQALSFDGGAAAGPFVDDPPPLTPGDRVLATVSFYYCEQTAGTPAGDGGGFCGIMRDGTVVYPGAAACHLDYLGQLFRIVGDPVERIYRCADTGTAVQGLHRDIWFESSSEGWLWQYAIGTVATIEVLHSGEPEQFKLVLVRTRTRCVWGLHV